MSALLDFYSGCLSDTRGRTLSDIWSFSASRLEDVHDYIQWLFPLPEASLFNGYAPLLTEEDMAAFALSPVLRANLSRSFNMMADFYGFKRTDSGLQKADDFNEKSANWLTPYNHNFLRISRILRSMSLLGLKEDARMFLRALEDVYADHQETIGAQTYGYWQRAVRPTPNP